MLISKIRRKPQSRNWYQESVM